MAAAVDAIGVGPFSEGFFAVEEDQVDIVGAGLAGQGLGQFQQKAGGGAAVVGADEVAVREKAWCRNGR